MITLVNEYSAVLDSCVLLPIKLCDLLLRLAEEPALYSPKWSSLILAEVEKNLRSGKFQISSEKAKYRIACMQSSFPEALTVIPAKIVEVMPIDAKDRHVLACAVISRADCIVTANLKHFPASDLSGFGIEAIHPDDFLVNQFGLSERCLLTKLNEQASKFGIGLSDHLTALQKSVPKFTALVGRRI